jgi:uncharacterized protein
MAVDLVQIRTLAREKEDENWEFRRFLKTLETGTEELDERVFRTTQRVWDKIDCTTCANCCREVKPTFSKEDVNRIAARLGMNPQAFVDAHLEHTEADDGNPWQTRTTPCPFLKDNRCSIYEDRPVDCREYPYLFKPEFVSRTMDMLERTFTCPIVYEVIEKLKDSTGFFRRRRR